MLSTSFPQPGAQMMQLLLKASADSPTFFAICVVASIVLVRYVLQLLQSNSSAFAADDCAKPLACEVDSSSPLGKKPRNTSESIQSDVAIAWAEKHGRFKYHGLRPNPVDASAGVPVYSLKPLEMPLPELSCAQAAALAELKGRVSDLSASHRTDSSTLIRYLKARKYNVAKTEKYFREAARWREEHGVNQIFTHWNLKAYEEVLAPWWLSGGFFGHGKKGEMIAYERLARSDWAGLVRRMPWEEIEKLDMVHCIRSLATCEEDCMRRGTPMGNGILVQDCYGFGYDQASFAATRALNRLVENRNFLMPECLTKILVIRAPAAWVYAWKMFSYILDPGIREKVQVAGNREGESLALLRKFIDDEDIPAYLGGKKSIDGDPECRKVIAPGGPMPEEALQRFLKLVAEGPSEDCEGNAAAHQTSVRWAPCMQREGVEEDEEGKRGRACCW